MAEVYVSRDLYELIIGEPLPVALFLNIHGKYIHYKNKGDVIDKIIFVRLELQKIKSICILKDDLECFLSWTLKNNPPKTLLETTNEPPLFSNAKIEATRAMLDIFRDTHPDKKIAQAIKSSQKLVLEIMKLPYASQGLSLLHNYSKGCVDHSVNVSVLSVYLAMQMGYTHAHVLQNIAAGSLLHDVGKSKIQITAEDNGEEIKKKMLNHPLFGVTLLEGDFKENTTVPNEIKIIIAQHHECFDGSGYPNKLRGNTINDLTRIVSIANLFDELMSEGKGTLIDRQKNAILNLDREYYYRFDPLKLDKALKILKLGI